jgi:ferredoxin--NADP+ reductase
LRTRLRPGIIQSTIPSDEHATKEAFTLYRILSKRTVGPSIREYVVEAHDIARVAEPGQFIVLRLHEQGERIPLTIVETDETTGGVTLVVQEVGKTTREMGDRFNVGDDILDVVGPLGEPTEIENYGTVVCVGGGVGIAPLLPIARALRAAGNHVVGIIGARSLDLLFYEDRMRDACDELHVMTNDGSSGAKGFVSDKLLEILESDIEVNHVWAIGPAIMMKVCADTTRPYGVPTTVSINSVMIDGTGMCGGCRVDVGGVAKFACVDGPEFDGHEVDFDLLMTRQGFYCESENCAMDRYVSEHVAAEGRDT